jgi:hypothetical protein
VALAVRVSMRGFKIHQFYNLARIHFDLFWKLSSHKECSSSFQPNKLLILTILKTDLATKEQLRMALATQDAGDEDRFRVQKMIKEVC